MNLSQAYLEWEQKTVERAKEEERRQVIENLRSCPLWFIRPRTPSNYSIYIGAFSLRIYPYFDAIISRGIDY